ncbi:MAG TPA: WhiB family transcriptional regulator [Frankiaceae bacterium]|jgi:hypothetical protein|nr:WhiB family transcriptional regulator [Frankiaceae bacterium]
MTAVDERVCAPRITSGREGEEPYSSWVRRAKCAGRTALFGDEQLADEALAVCGVCPVRRQCRRWALTNAVDGVAGGMTASDRAAWRQEAGEPEPVVMVEDFLLAEVVSADTTWGRGRSEAILNAVARWTDDGETARQIGLRLGVTRRTVNRLRARCRERQAS